MGRQKLPQHKDDCIKCTLPEPNGLYYACMNCRNKAVEECRRLEAELERAMADLKNENSGLHLQRVSNSVICYTCNVTKGTKPKGENYCNMCDHYF